MTDQSGSNSDTPLVLFMPSGKRGRFPKGTPIIEAARELGVYVESVCGGRGICGRCQIEVAEGKFAKHGITSCANNISPPGAKEIRYRQKRELKQGRRLSCSSTLEGDLVIDIPNDVQINQQTIRKDDDGREIERNPSVHICNVVVDEPDMHNPLGDADRLIKALDANFGYKWDNLPLHLPYPILPDLQQTLRAGKWEVTAAIHHDKANEQPKLIALWPGLHNEAYGVACDIGSTTIALHLISLLSGTTLATIGAPNPQIRFGEDLMSRVSYVMMNPEGRDAMTQAVRKTINTMIEQACEQAGIDPNGILELCFVGNPVMHHLFLGIDPTQLGGAPFALAVSGALSISATQLDLLSAQGASVYMVPCIAGHVGADAAAAALCEGPHRQKEMMLLVDVGTNAEIILGNDEQVLAASSPTGPAFEGAEISCGQRAAPGAVERVRIDRETLEPTVQVIGIEGWLHDQNNNPELAPPDSNTQVTGICGSAIIEVVAEMYLSGIINEDGVFQQSNIERSHRIKPDPNNERTLVYVLWEGKQSLYITQNDVRAIQLAKAALYAGIKLLMDHANIKQVDRIAFAGAFGSFIDPKYAMALGLIPDCRLDHVKPVGNAAGVGAKMALLNREHRHEVETMVTNINKIETALEPKFQEYFVHAMAFPNKVDSFPHLSKVLSLPEKTETPHAQGDKPVRRRRRRSR